MGYQCLIFDCDGVLVDSEEISNSVLLEMTSEIDIHLDMKYVTLNFSGTSLQSIFRNIEDLTNEKLPDTFEKEYRRRTFERFKTDLKPITGITEILKLVDIPLCVASSGPREKIELNLRTTELLDFFDGNIFSSYEIGSWKPSPKIFLHAASKMGFAPNECLVIEDSLAGIRAARNGGFDVCGYTIEKNRKSFEKEGALVITSMTELSQILQ